MLLRNAPTSAEKLLWSGLKGKQTGYKFRRQHSLGPFIVDFFCPKLRLVIEVDGATHKEAETQEKEKTYAQTRQTISNIQAQFFAGAQRSQGSQV